MNTQKLQKPIIEGLEIGLPIFQGGMGVGVSRYRLAGAVSKEGGLGIISSAALKDIYLSEYNECVTTEVAVMREIEMAKTLSGGKPVGINIMCALVGDYEVTVKAAIDAKVDAIISGAGLPLGLPKIQEPGDTLLIPIVSSARALDLIAKRWERDKYPLRVVILEGPKAGGHLGFKWGQINDPAFALERLLEEVLESGKKYGNPAVVVAGGIYSHEDIVRLLNLGASAVQMGTRFLATNESSASDLYKQSVIASTQEDIAVVSYPENGPSSPCGLPFRILKTSPAYTAGRRAKCNKGYLLQRGADGKLSVCQAAQTCPNNKHFLCLCNELLASAGCEPEEPALYTVGTNAHRVNKIIPVADLMKELCGEIPSTE